VPASATELDVLAAFDGLFTALTERRDADGALRLFVGDDDIVMWGSDEDELAVGRPEVAALQRAIAASATRLKFSWQRRWVRVDGDAAWVNATGDVRIEEAGRTQPAMSYRVTAVLLRRDGAWRWHTFSGSMPNPS
jgi:uncharacterized protein (TIGR02246 family)